MENLEDVIVASLEDAELPPEPTETADPTTTTDEPVVEAPESTSATTEPITEVVEVKSPSARTVEPIDDFEKKFGITGTASSGRENRIPYSRVKKITEKAEKDTEAKTKATYEPKIVEYETKVKDYETKLASYDARWKDVATFEHTMLNDQGKFLDMLAGIPAYQPFFAKINDLLQKEASGTLATTTPTDSVVSSDMPLPKDGANYTQEELQTLLAWNAKQAVTQAEQRIVERYAPLETQFQAHQRMQTLLPKVKDQITEARKLPMFTESEDEITAALQADRALTLEGAYNKVVVPKLIAAQTAATTDRATIEKETREKVLQELKTRPSSTSTSVRSTQPSSQSTGPKSLEDIIADSISGLKGR